MVEIAHFTSVNEDFKYLDNLLDEEYYDRFGDIYAQYVIHNSLEKVDDFYIAYDGEKSVACGCIRGYADDTAELKRIFVIKEYRRKGIACEIIKQCERGASERGYESIILETGVEMPEAVKLYENLGYEIVDNYGPYVNDEASCCLQKKLV